MRYEIERIIKKLLSLRYWYVAILAILIVGAGHLWSSSEPQKKNLDVPIVATQVQSQSPGWHPVTIGGGGYITGIYIHPQNSNLVYVRTDNGGFYRWQTNQERWIPISNSLPRGFWDYDHNSGGEALALDPQNPDLVYIAVGKYGHEPGTVYKSVDRGVNWQPSDLAVPMGGDQDKRWAGDRLVVDPFDSNLLLFGSRQDGLWRSPDGGISWTQVSGLSGHNVHQEDSIGILALAFDPQQENLVYASIYGDGVYQSADKGLTWQRLVDSPSKVMQLEVAQDSIVYATNHESPQVSKYDQGKWSNISPQGFIHSTFNGLSLHPQAPDTLVVSEGEKGKAKIYYSSDRGAHWTLKKAQLNNTIPWLADQFFNDHPAGLVFDPQNPEKVWLTDWFSVWHTDNINQPTVKWTSKIAGIEQTVFFSLSSPPEGTILLSGIADQDGFYHQNLTVHPQSRLGVQRQGTQLTTLKLTGQSYLDNYFQDTFHLAYCQNQPQHLVRVGGWRDVYYLGVTSDDGGVSWQPWANIPADKLFMRVAIASNNPEHFVVTTSEDQPLVTLDGGASWQEVSGLPDGETGPWNWNQPLAADGLNSNQFYYYAAGKVYRSSDGGFSFQIVSQDFPPAERYVLKTVPGVEGEIWLSLDQGGLYHSQDGGISFRKSESVDHAHLVTIGKPIKDEVAHSIYVYGTLNNGQSGLFISPDATDNWLQLNKMSQMPRSIKILAASHQQPGLIFAGTDGRGAYYQLIN